MKKKIIFLVVIILVVIIAVITLLTFFGKKEYDVDKIVSLIDFKVTNNMILKSETVLADESEHLRNGRTEIYVKDNKMSAKYYIGTEYEEGVNKLFQEYFIDTEANTQIYLNHFSKEFRNAELSEAFRNLIVEEINSYKEMLDTSKETYQYCGEEDGIIKVSILNEFLFEGMQKQYFYINKKEKLLEKVESYNVDGETEELSSTTTFSYSYDTVKNEDVNFDITKYSDYINVDQEL